MGSNRCRLRESQPVTTATTIIGNLTADPKLAYTQAGAPVANGTIAVNHRWQQNGDWKESTSFVKWAAFGQLAENIAASCTKGTNVVAVGHLETDSYETKTGEKRSELQLRVQHMAVSMTWTTVTVEQRTTSQPSRRPVAITDDEEPF